MIRRVVDLLLLVGVASLIYFKRVTEDGALTGASLRYRSDFVFLAAVTLAMLVGVFGLFKGQRIMATKVERVMFCALASYVIFCLVATLMSMGLFGLGFDLIGFSNFSKTILGIALLFVTYVRLKENPQLFKWLAAALYVPPAFALFLGVIYLISPSSYLSAFEDPLSLLADAHRFQGLTSNPFQLLINNFVAIGFVWPLVIDRVFKRRLIVATTGLSYIIGLVLLVFWTLTRTGLIVVVFVFSCGAALILYHGNRNPLKVVISVAMGVLLILIAWALLPGELTEMYVSRFYSKDVTVGQLEYYTGGRADIWTYFTDVAVAHPFGIGFNFEQRFSIDSSYQEKLNPHSALLIAWMFGGVGACVSVAVAMWAAVRVMRIEIRRGRWTPGFLYYAGAVTGLLGMWIPLLGPNFADFTHAILLAMVLSGVPAIQRATAAGRREPMSANPLMSQRPVLS